MTTSRSMPDGICLVPVPLKRLAFRSIAAMLSLWAIAADLLDTILMAAVCPVTACLANLTRPVAPSPSVFPNCHGPTFVFLFPFPETLEVVEIAEFLFEPA